jgi:hypothetical protein
VPTVGAPAVADSGVALEDEAHRAAAAALSGAPAKLSRGRAAVGFQGWTSPEHGYIEALAGASYAYDFGGLVLTASDFATLTGDYVEVIHDPGHNLYQLAAQPSRSPGQVPGTRDEILAAIAHYNPQDPRVKGIVFGDAVLTAMRQRFNRQAVYNVTHFAHPNAVDKTDAPSAGNSYRELHELAIYNAYRGDASVGHAYEAMADHYLTDSFSAGHVRTPRADIQTYWDQLVPAFKTNLIDVLAARIRRELLDEHPILSTLFNAGAEYVLLGSMVRSELEDTFGPGGVPGLGDLLSLLLHDTDNEEGLVVENELGMQWRTYGDGKLFANPAQLGPMVLAVRQGHDDIDRAYQLHEAGDALPIGAVCAALKVPGTDRYAAERMMPRAVAGANGAQTWRAPRFDDLVDRPVRDDRPALTYHVALMRSCQPGGTIYTMVAGAREKIDETALGGTYHPRKAFEDGVLAKLVIDPVGLIGEIIAG